MIQKFYKTEEGRWYVDLPDYISSNVGTFDNLEMVAGADIMLDILSKGQDEVTLSVRTIDPEDDSYSKITLVSEDNDEQTGANYMFNDFEIWLCSVMLYVFNEYPSNIWFKKIY